MVADKRVKTFAFTPVSFSDAGGYTCQVTVMSDLLSVPITANSSNSINVTLIRESMNILSTSVLCITLL